MTTTILRVDLCDALRRCCDAHPAENHRLHPDASRMADLLGVMICHKLAEVPQSTVEAPILEAIDRWAS